MALGLKNILSTSVAISHVLPAFNSPKCTPDGQPEFQLQIHLDQLPSTTSEFSSKLSYLFKSSIHEFHMCYLTHFANAPQFPYTPIVLLQFIHCDRIVADDSVERLDLRRDL
ncbi:hypothetical protein PILCRDRAFT_206129 [Piloderma croceum F 1598]|uniref:Uncharacterized protein n=1 Tax=Piloderma croceum (strain F 1598) TaxID=765440 RepID=A0A0C3GEC9_PILCF|nr:hypothetical protein PILCRDRAFT_206129 [Piloderma croceum F 1598]